MKIHLQQDGEIYSFFFYSSVNSGDDNYLKGYHSPCAKFVEWKHKLYSL